MKTNLVSKINYYLFQKFLLIFFVILACLLSIIFIFDLIELLRRAADVESITFNDIIVLSLLKLPEVGQKVFTFAILFTGMYVFWQLTKKHELVILRAAGFSIWQFIMPIILCAFFIGLIKIMAINPLGVLMVQRYEVLEAQLFKRGSSPISFSDQGLWIRQEIESGSVILHAEEIKLPSWKLKNIIIFYFDRQNNFNKRIDAQLGRIEKNVWVLNNPVENKIFSPPEKKRTILFETNITREEIEENFSSPEAVSFWQFPENIRRLEQTGLNANQLKVYYQNLLSQPLLFMAMILLAATVSLRPPRAHGGGILIVCGVGIGFIVFFSSNFLQALGISNQIPLFIAAWFPALISFILGIGLLMHMEDG